MQITSYEEILGLTKEAKEKKLVPSRVKSQKAKADLEIAKLEESIASHENAVTEGCSKADLNIHEISDRLDDLAMAQRKLEQLREIVDQLFPKSK